MMQVIFKMKMSVSFLFLLVSLSMAMVCGTDKITVVLVNSTGFETNQGVMSCPCNLHVSMTLTDIGHCIYQSNSTSGQCSVDVKTRRTLNIDNEGSCAISYQFPGKAILQLGVDLSQTANTAVFLDPSMGFKKKFCLQIDTNIVHKFYNASGRGNTSLLLEVKTSAPSTTTLSTTLTSSNQPGLTSIISKISSPTIDGTRKKENDGSLSSAATAGIAIGVIAGVILVVLVCLGLYFKLHGKMICVK